MYGFIGAAGSKKEKKILKSGDMEPGLLSNEVTVLAILTSLKLLS